MGDAECGAGPGVRGKGYCSRVSCDKGAAIRLCNENDDPMKVACSIVGDIATTIVNYCSNVRPSLFLFSFLPCP